MKLEIGNSGCLKIKPELSVDITTKQTGSLKNKNSEHLNNQARTANFNIE